MSIWGKIIGGTAGFALGGPLGAILGMMAGNVFDKSKSKSFNFYQITNQQKQNLFALSIIILSAKLSKSDGLVTKDEILSFLKDKIASWWMPDDVVFIDEIPHTATGKIQKLALREKFKGYKLENN